MPLAVKSRAPAVIGLDIGSKFIKICVGRARGGRVELLAAAVGPTPGGIFRQDEITDPPGLGRALRALLQQNNIREKDVVSAVSGQSSLVVRIIELPRITTRKELDETMRWEVERHVPFAAEQTVIDYAPLQTAAEVAPNANMEVLLAVALEELVMQHLEALKEARLKPKAIDVEALASARSVLELRDGQQPPTTAAVVNIGASRTDINIYRDGRIAFTRTIQIGGNNLTKTISEVLLKTPDEAERLKVEMGSAPSLQAAAAAEAPAADFGEAGGFDFDEPGGVLGGTFGIGPGEEAEATIDVAGGGIDAFAIPNEEGPAAPMFSLDDDDAGANPFDAADSSTNIFDTPAPADPFGPPPGQPTRGAETTELSVRAAASEQAPMSDEDYVRAQVADAMTPVLEELATELRRSLEFYRNRANGLGAEHVYLCGGTSRLPGLAQYLAEPANLDIAVSVANPLTKMDAGPSVNREYVQDVGPLFSVAAGLMLRELLQDTGPARRRTAAPAKPAAAPLPPQAAEPE